MIESILVSTSDHKDIERSGSQFYPSKNHKLVTIHGLSACIRAQSDSDLSEYIARDEERSLLIAGSIVNLTEIRSLLLSIDPFAANYNTAETIICLYSYFGANGIKLLEGFYTLFFISKKKELIVYTDPFGHMPVYAHVDKRKTLWITNEMKSLIPISSTELKLKPASSFDYEKKLPEDFTLFLNTKKFSPGQRYEFKAEDSDLSNIIGKSYFEYHDKSEIKLDKKRGVEIIDHLLQEFIRVKTTAKTTIAIPLSGGLDSSIVSSIAAKQKRNLHTFTIGTAEANEYRYAKEVSQFIGSTHHEHEIDFEDFLDGVVNMSFYNEIYDSLCLEIQSPIYYVYKKISKISDSILTGFGADMFFGGHLDLATNPESINDKLKENIFRIRWTGEYSPFASQSLNLEVQHPFCQNKLVNLAMMLNPTLKVSKEENKHLLREVARIKAYLPESICSRKKIAIEQASSLNHIFSKRLKLNDCFSYTEKNKFTYNIFKDLFENEIPKPDLKIDLK